ncbi:MAG: hypothetical protein PHS44_00785 [Candidatus Dojkabacteria bacterium]|nr:hypothetical protein [Candidatus Dojkabacteria bacterium]
MNIKINSLIEVISLLKPLMILDRVDSNIKNGQIVIESESKTLMIVRSNSIKLTISSGRLMKYRNNLSNALCNPQHFKGFLQKCSPHILSLDHIGFCYKVNSAKQELATLKSSSRKTKIDLYIMKSADNSTWLFAGDTDKPMIEFLPIQIGPSILSTNYWLPHIHICLNTSFQFDELETVCHETFSGNRSIFINYAEGNVAYQSRLWLGTVTGINFCLDFKLNVDNTYQSRKTRLQKL